MYEQSVHCMAMPQLSSSLSSLTLHLFGQAGSIVSCFSTNLQPHFFLCSHFVVENLSLNYARFQKNVRCRYRDVRCDFNLEPKHIALVAVTLYPTLIRLRPPSGFSRLFPWWVSQLWSENCASTLVTPVSFPSWPWLMYCSHYMLVQPGCSLCSALKLWHCLSLPLASAQVWAASVSMICASSCWSAASGEWRIPSICCRSSRVRFHSALVERMSKVEIWNYKVSVSWMKHYLQLISGAFS